MLHDSGIVKMYPNFMFSNFEKRKKKRCHIDLRRKCLQNLFFYYAKNKLYLFKGSRTKHNLTTTKTKSKKI